MCIYADHVSKGASQKLRKLRRQSIVRKLLLNLCVDSNVDDPIGSLLVIPPLATRRKGYVLISWC